MNMTTMVDLAEALGTTRDDANNALKRYVHPDCIPETEAGQLEGAAAGRGAVRLLHG